MNAQKRPTFYFFEGGALNIYKIVASSPDSSLAILLII